MYNQSITHENLKNYYGKILHGSSDLKTSACCCGTESLPVEVKAALKQIDDEIINRFYGCGSPIPPVLEDCTVLDLGCGTGRDVYIASKLVGENGRAIGIDMTDEQLDIARRSIDSMTRKFGYQNPNVDFQKGYIEDLKSAKISDNSVDIVISNCVINLSPDKHAVLSEIFRVLKPGGELFFSDIFSGRRMPEQFKDDPVLHGECLAGAMYIEDFRRLLNDLGCPDYRVTAKRRILLNNPAIETKIGMIDFYSMTIRAFKLAALEDICEDYGQVAVYQGSIPNHPHYFDLDNHHRFITGKQMLVCGNTAAMVSDTRFAGHFKVYGDRSVHYGPFDCAPASVKAENPDEGGSGGACC
ncbi:MAG: methyltransferase domain-containing protein [Deltaproteobacteria bacterium]|nr:methyltransferase domain-containing protein [Deltaproteobacteria bacterium]